MKKWLLLCVFIATVLSLAAQTVTIADSTVLRATPARVGLNLRSPTNYDAGQIFKNLYSNSGNPGFEPLLHKEIWQVQGGAIGLSTTQFNSNINNSQYAGTPANWWVGGTITIVQSDTGGAELNCSRTIATSSVDATHGPIFTWTSPCSAAIQVGDVAIVSRQEATTSSSDWSANGMGWYSTVTGSGIVSGENSDLCSTCGIQALSLNATSGSAKISNTMDASASNRFIQLNGCCNYTLAFWAKTASGSPSLSCVVYRNISGGWNKSQQLGITPALTSTWTQYSLTYSTPSEAQSTAAAPLQTDCTATGGQVYLDNMSFAKTSGTSTKNTSKIRDEVVQALSDWFGPSTSGAARGELRYGPAPNSDTLLNLLAPDNSRVPTSNGFATADYTGGSANMNLHDFLSLCNLVGAEPEIIIPITFTVSDMQNLSDYLYGGSGTTYGAQRIALGQTASWASVFSHIHLELGNENWNSGFLAQGIGFRSGTNPSVYYDYVKRANALFNAMRAQPSYSSAATILLVGLQTANQQGTSPLTISTADGYTLNGYTGLNISDYSTTSLLWLPTMTEPWARIHDANDQSGQYQSNALYNGAYCGAGGGTQCVGEVYEYNNQTVGGSITQAAADTFVDAAGYGTIVANQFLQNLQYQNTANQNIYDLGQYSSYAGGILYHTFGMLVDAGGATAALDGASYRGRPQFLDGRLLNSAVIGAMVSCPITSGQTLYNLPTNNNGVNAQTNVPAVYTYCFKQGLLRELVAINTDLVNSHPLTFAGTNPPTGSVSKSVLVSSSIGASNEAAGSNYTGNTAAAVTIATSTLSSPTSDSLPAYSTTVYSWSVPGTPIASITPSSVSFPSMAVCSSATSQQVTLTNSGTAVLSLTSIGLGGSNPSSFSIPVSTCGASVAVGANCTFSVGFTPVATGSLSAIVQVTDNAAGELYPV